MPRFVTKHAVGLHAGFSAHHHEQIAKVDLLASRRVVDCIQHRGFHRLQFRALARDVRRECDGRDEFLKQAAVAACVCWARTDGRRLPGGEDGRGKFARGREEKLPVEFRYQLAMAPKLDDPAFQLADGLPALLKTSLRLVELRLCSLDLFLGGDNSRGETDASRFRSALAASVAVRSASCSE